MMDWLLGAHTSHHLNIAYNNFSSPPVFELGRGNRRAECCQPTRFFFSKHAVIGEFEWCDPNWNVDPVFCVCKSATHPKSFNFSVCFNFPKGCQCDLCSGFQRRPNCFKPSLALSCFVVAGAAEAAVAFFVPPRPSLFLSLSAQTQTPFASTNRCTRCLQLLSHQPICVGSSCAIKSQSTISCGRDALIQLLTSR